jgi:hypothetical protein
MQEVDVLGKSAKNIDEIELFPYETKFIKVNVVKMIEAKINKVNLEVRRMIK